MRDYNSLLSRIQTKLKIPSAAQRHSQKGNMVPNQAVPALRDGVQKGTWPCSRRLSLPRPYQGRPILRRHQLFPPMRMGVAPVNMSRSTRRPRRGNTLDSRNPNRLITLAAVARSHTAVPSFTGINALSPNRNRRGSRVNAYNIRLAYSATTVFYSYTISPQTCLVNGGLHNPPYASWISSENVNVSLRSSKCSSPYTTMINMICFLIASGESDIVGGSLPLASTFSPWWA